jgi:hypothetical protein
VPRISTLIALILLLAGTLSCRSSTNPSPQTAEFVVQVVDETFVLRTTDMETIRRAEDNMRGRNGMFPLGPLRPGSGGFNAPWTWHLDPDETRLVELAIELCDGRPSYVETHQTEYGTYCPWGARVIARRD